MIDDVSGSSPAINLWISPMVGFTQQQWKDNTQPIYGDVTVYIAG